MIKFFRRIRQKLLSENRLTRYLIYAIGEIVLVVIGILIALQINNWNEGRKGIQAEKEYLQGIRSDLIQDTVFLSEVIAKHKYRMAQIKKQDSSIHVRNIDIVGSLPKVEPVKHVDYFFRVDRRFRAKLGSYSSLISEGKSSIISNRDLFSRIQSIYEQDLKSAETIGQEMWDKNIRLGEKYAYEIKYENYGTPVVITNKAMIADLNTSFGLLNLYVRFSSILLADINDIIISIEAELSSLD